MDIDSKKSTDVLLLNDINMSTENEVEETDGEDHHDVASSISSVSSSSSTSSSSSSSSASTMIEVLNDEVVHNDDTLRPNGDHHNNNSMDTLRPQTTPSVCSSVSSSSRSPSLVDRFTIADSITVSTANNEVNNSSVLNTTNTNTTTTTTSSNQHLIFLDTKPKEIEICGDLRLQNDPRFPPPPPPSTDECDDLVDEDGFSHSSLINGGGGVPYAVLSMPEEYSAFSCRFVERRLNLHNRPGKIGRAIGNKRPAQNNAFFDCKVLSRNHALLWYKDGMFFLRDVCSSNGTFVNQLRLSPPNEKSEPHQLFSGDIVKFGVEVVDKKQVHPCVIAEIRLYHPDGREALRPCMEGSINEHKQSITGSRQRLSSDLLDTDRLLRDANMGNQALLGSMIISREQLFEMFHNMRLATRKQKQLEARLEAMQTAMQTAVQEAKANWRSVIGEDQLMSRIETLQAKVKALMLANHPTTATTGSGGSASTSTTTSTASSVIDTAIPLVNGTHNQLPTERSDQFGIEPETIIESLRDELLQLISDKEKYELASKVSLQKALEDASYAKAKLENTEQRLQQKEIECVELNAKLEEDFELIKQLIEQTTKQKKEIEQTTEATQKAIDEKIDAMEDWKKERKGFCDKIGALKAQLKSDQEDRDNKARQEAEEKIASSSSIKCEMNVNEQGVQTEFVTVGDQASTVTDGTTTTTTTTTISLQAPLHSITTTTTSQESQVESSQSNNVSQIRVLSSSLSSTLSSSTTAKNDTINDVNVKNVENFIDTNNDLVIHSLDEVKQADVKMALDANNEQQHYQIDSNVSTTKKLDSHINELTESTRAQLVKFQSTVSTNLCMIGQQLDAQKRAIDRLIHLMSTTLERVRSQRKQLSAQLKVLRAQVVAKDGENVTLRQQLRNAERLIDEQNGEIEKFKCDIESLREASQMVRNTAMQNSSKTTTTTTTEMKKDDDDDNGDDGGENNEKDDKLEPNERCIDEEQNKKKKNFDVEFSTKIITILNRLSSLSSSSSSLKSLMTNSSVVLNTFNEENDENQEKISTSTELNSVANQELSSPSSNIVSRLETLVNDWHDLRDENVHLRGELHELQEQFGMLSYQSQLSFAMALLPLVVIFIAIVLAFYPILSYFMATADDSTSEYHR